MTGFPRAVRDTVLKRADGRCERCALWADDIQIHHRRPRAMGGSTAEDTNTAANALALCARCHQNVESMRVTATHLGYLVPQGHAPAEAPVFRQGQWVNLGDDGSVAVRA